MANLEAVLHDLRKERNRAQSELDKLDQAICAIQGLGTTTTSARLKRGSGRRTLSPDARRRIAEAQRRRWAKVKGRSGSNTPKRVLSPAARRKIAAAQKARWAKFKAGKKGGAFVEGIG